MNMYLIIFNNSFTIKKEEDADSHLRWVSIDLLHDIRLRSSEKLEFTS